MTNEEYQEELNRIYTLYRVGIKRIPIRVYRPTPFIRLFNNEFHYEKCVIEFIEFRGDSTLYPCTCTVVRGAKVNKMSPFYIEKTEDCVHLFKPIFLESI